MIQHVPLYLEDLVSPAARPLPTGRWGPSWELRPWATVSLPGLLPLFPLLTPPTLASSWDIRGPWPLPGCVTLGNLSSSLFTHLAAKKAIPDVWMGFLPVWAAPGTSWLLEMPC